MLAQDTSLAGSCINSDYYNEAIPAILREIVMKYNIQGFTDNSWRGYRKTHICYCENCRKRFLQDTGRSLPEKVDWEDDTYRRWIQWSYGRRAEIWDLYNQTVSRLDENCVWAGFFHGDPCNRLNEFTDFHEIGKRMKIVFLDHQCRDLGNGMDMEQNSALGSLYHLCCGEDIQIAECTSFHARCNTEGRFRASAPAKAETVMWQMEGMAGGISPVAHYIGVTTHDKRRFMINQELNAWHQKVEPYLYDRYEMADVGVIWSQENADFYGKDRQEERVADAWFGIRHALVKSRIPFMAINVHDIEKYASRVKTLILPDIAVLGDADARALVQYAQGGGNLIIFGESGTLDESGYPLKERRLWEWLNMRLSGKQREREIDSYLRILRHDEDVMKGFQETELLPCGGILTEMESRGPLQKIASWVPRIQHFPPERSYLRGEERQTGTVFVGKMESGARVVIFATDIERCYGRHELPDHRRLIANAVMYTLQDKPLIRVSGAGTIDIKVYQQEERRIIHLNNLTGSSLYGFMEEFIPLGPIRIGLRCEEGEDYAVYGMVREQKLPAVMKDGYLNFTLENLEANEMIVIEEEGSCAGNE